MKRIIVDYSKLTKEILDLLVEKYPDGYNAMDIINFRDAKKNLIDAIRVETEDTIYLVKVSKKLENSMEEHEVDNDNDDFDDNDDDLIFDQDIDISEDPDFDN
ncbi:MAG: hypothetical protein CR968_02315 [Flavobacteriia bacterium]|nr:MAG: hypothetical protein CR968_02315 [Flavobacteriia bacterium]